MNSDKELPNSQCPKLPFAFQMIKALQLSLIVLIFTSVENLSSLDRMWVKHGSTTGEPCDLISPFLLQRASTLSKAGADLQQ